MQEKILIIGAGPGQYQIIKTAKELGYYVIAVSQKNNYKSFEIVDEVFYEDIFNVSSIVEFARNKGVNGVLSDQSDMAAPIVAQVAEQLGLPNWGYENALNFTDKVRMRAVFEELGLPIPKYYHATNLNEAHQAVKEIGYPVIIKPVDSFASRGVFKVYQEKELDDLFPQSLNVSRSKNVVIEELLEGDQYFCQGFVQDYKLRLYAFSDRYYYDLPDVAIPYTNAFPAKISYEFQKRMTEMFSKVVNYLHPLFGHVWAEWIYNKKTDKLYIIEMAIRGGGAYVTTELIPRAYGIDSQPFLVNAAMSHNEKKFENEIINQRSAAFFSFLLPQGEIIHIQGVDKVDEIKGVVKTDIKDIKIGDKVPPIINKDSRYGMIIIEGCNRDAVDEVLNKVKETLIIKVSCSDGIKDIIWE